MMCYEKNGVKKFKKHCDKDVLERVENLIVQIKKNPYRYGKLTTNQRSARCGKYRIIFSIIGGAVVIDNIGNRSNVYNSL
ncbi:type II toxin-antitoxin system RelE family toxin [Methanobrevibacter sp.]|uniref:type II toxin-antitoxin system RelE family toxin n=1 Tax=Methanobrevibacter sp. TaxID=66852 RepID=UPI002E7A25A9|nr:type II toxin-antitoxin system RelE/ParE family toxin [Methanobrevibacter sp.]MEE1335969.1 type II toxin-antitoxin system RelE/ParE family toxin [Methanobrevibacter sp.]